MFLAKPYLAARQLRSTIRTYSKMTTNLSDRMKLHEEKYRAFLIFENLDDALIIRVDGKAFHTYTRGAKVPFDENFQDVMNDVAVALCNNTQGAVLAYVQSDEVSIVVRPIRDKLSVPWFGGNVQKICSITAAIASVTMTTESSRIFGLNRQALFDSRAFVLPRNEIVNYLIWRQTDALRNSVQMLARSHFSHKKLLDKSCDEMKEMLVHAGDPWEEYSSGSQRGRVIIKRMSEKTTEYFHKKTGVVNVVSAIRSRWEVDPVAPTFLQDRNYVESRFDTNAQNTKE